MAVSDCFSGIWGVRVGVACRSSDLVDDADFFPLPLVLACSGFLGGGILTLRLLWQE